MSDHIFPPAGSETDLLVRDLTLDGGALARSPSGAVIFLDRGLPGETVKARIDSTSSRFAKATTLATLTPSPDAVPAPCPWFSTCGGCAWQDLAYPAQTAWKGRQARETLRRVGKIDPEKLTWTAECLASPRQYGYRNKVEFAFGQDANGKPAVGLRRRGSRAIVAVDDCLLCHHSAAVILQAVRRWLAESGLDHEPASSALRHLVLRMPDETADGQDVCIVEVITYPTSRTSELGRKVRDLFSRLQDIGVSGCVHSARRDRAAVAYGENVVYSQGFKTMRERFGDVVLDAPPQAFLQTNTGAATMVYEQVRRLASLTGGRVLDGYCGVGGIALTLAPDADEVLGTDSVAAAVRQAKSNASRNKITNCTFTSGDLAQVLAGYDGHADLAVLDPPRAGMGREVIDSLLKLDVKRIISVSCDAATQARDLAALAPRYRVSAGCVVDMFPHTPHFETIYLLEKA